MAEKLVRRRERLAAHPHRTNHASEGLPHGEVVVDDVDERILVLDVRHGFAESSRKSKTSTTRGCMPRCAENVATGPAITRGSPQLRSSGPISTPHRTPS